MSDGTGSSKSTPREKMFRNERADERAGISVQPAGVRTASRNGTGLPGLV